MDDIVPGYVTRSDPDRHRRDVLLSIAADSAMDALEDFFRQTAPAGLHVYRSRRGGVVLELPR